MWWFILFVYFIFTWELLCTLILTELILFISGKLGSCREFKLVVEHCVGTHKSFDKRNNLC